MSSPPANSAATAKPPFGAEIEAFLKDKNTNLSQYGGDKAAEVAHTRAMAETMTISRVVAPCGVVAKRGTGSSLFGSQAWRSRFVVCLLGTFESHGDVVDFMAGAPPRKAPLELAGYAFAIDAAEPRDGEGRVTVRGAPGGGGGGGKVVLIRVPAAKAAAWQAALAAQATVSEGRARLDALLAAAAAAGQPAAWEAGVRSPAAAAGGAPPPYAAFVGTGEDAAARRALSAALKARLGAGSAVARRPDASVGQLFASVHAAAAAAHGAAEEPLFGALAAAGAAALLIGQAIERDFDGGMDGDAVRAGALEMLGKIALVPAGRDALLDAGVLAAVAEASFLDTLQAGSFSALCFILAGMGPGFSTARPPTKESTSPRRSVAAFVRAALVLTEQAARRKAAGVGWVPAAVRACLSVCGAPRAAAAAFARAGGFSALLRARRGVYAAAVRGDADALEAGPTFDGGVRALAADAAALFGAGGGQPPPQLLYDPYAEAVASSTAKFNALKNKVTGLGYLATMGLAMLLGDAKSAMGIMGAGSLRLVEVGAEGAEAKRGIFTVEEQVAAEFVTSPLTSPF